MTLLHDVDVDADPVTPKKGTRSRAAQRALDRRHKRLERHNKQTNRNAERRTTSSEKSRAHAIPFVVPVIALLVLGLGLSLWLSTKAAADSYRLGVERQQNQALLDRRDSLKRTYESGDSAPELSDKATKLGMIPAQNPARMIVGDNGRPRVAGDPTPAQGKGLRTINPPVGPDPVASIDPKKVDDSVGLPGDGSQSSDAEPSSTPDDSATAPSTAASSTPAPGAPANGAAPNVLPATPNAPGANSTENR
ncbi:hypothetical protein [Gordonia rhizosphera]|uniref:Cell division protein FtsL n=1 Tax=Gordonia rhizosphera NBRC 16068 TaxID=1108045 RepID=K6WDZ5_9ACTN|nr:hypothetical protein [Gordonia rhizosphera]GAB90402.1 hypothetical protein GORHZ_102_00290 [Gordonia rhizosphera NBRC 16068]